MKQELADLYAVLSHLDAQVGRVLAALRETGAYEKTIVIFITDNGAGVGGQAARLARLWRGQLHSEGHFTLKSRKVC